jgi:hypothetical protein
MPNPAAPGAGAEASVARTPARMQKSAVPAFAAGPQPEASPTPWRFDNPFCDVLAALVPEQGSEPGAEYALELFARDGTRVAAHVTLIGADAAYDANVPATNLQGAAGDRRTDAVMVKLEKPAIVHYFFVDSFSIDGVAPVTCPSYVFLSGSGPTTDAMSGLGLQSVTAAFLQKLPDLPCGKAYVGPSIERGNEPLVGHYGDTRRTTRLHVYVDSYGHAVQATIETSSGVDGLDDAAVAGVRATEYRSAQFLCTPVVSELDMEMEYRP